MKNVLVLHSELTILFCTSLTAYIQLMGSIYEAEVTGHKLDLQIIKHESPICIPLVLIVLILCGEEFKCEG